MRYANIAIIALITIAGCIAGNSVLAQNRKSKTVKLQFKAGPQTLVYKTRKDYSNHVPVLLSDDKTTIVSYPDPKDIKTGGKYPTPTRLKKGYLLDNRGIGLNVAYLKWTYAEYAALAKVPSQEEMMKMIIDKNPLTELCNCGSRYAFKNVVNDLNHLILSRKLRKVCKVVK